MKHIFVVNTHAGKARAKEELSRLLVGFEYDHEIYYTRGHKDATEFVRRRCEEEPEGELRFYACGGDGTLKEVVEGVYGHDNADITVVPLGSGNDFVKYYGGADNFLDLRSLACAPSTYIDLIKVNDHLCVNAVNFGFESYAANVMNNVRHKKFIGGKNSYTTGILMGLIFAMKNHAKVKVDGEQLVDGEYLLGSVANGRFVGGGYQCAPRALNSDGQLEVCVVNTISHFSVPKLIKIYKAGEHIEHPAFKKILNYRRAKKVEITFDRDMCIALDGELIDVREFVCEVIPSAVRFAAVECNEAARTPDVTLVN